VGDLLDSRSVGNRFRRVGMLLAASEGFEVGSGPGGSIDLTSFSSLKSHSLTD
jgi:hypothetical protein